ncbi:unnamed protein product, partial [Nesidiocoris tenuis]
PRRDEPQTPVGSLDTGSELRSSKRLIKVDYSYLDGVHMLLCSCQEPPLLVTLASCTRTPS